jgi:maleylpyruvate isomerase
VAARTDLATDPDVLDGLASVRLGTAFFRRWLDRLGDDELDAPSLLPGWTRRHVLAHVGYNARAVARLVAWAATGEETPMYPSTEARAAEIELGATLNPEALRNLVEHAAIDLDVRWRDLPANRWGFRVVTAQGRDVPVAETIWMRTREVWLHAVDLGNGARLDQVPPAVLVRLVGDIHSAWAKRSETGHPALRAVDTVPPTSWPAGSTACGEVCGTLASVAGWASGRTTDPGEELRWESGEPHPAPRWI